MLETIRHEADFCVVGGGLAGLCAALAAARHGAHVILMQDRPMLGGNASSEIRMWVCGAHGPNNRETGIIEELLLENRYRNPWRNWSLWDIVLLGAAWQEPNLKLLLNCSCNQARMSDNRIVSITGWQTTTQSWHTVEAALFADCSGDSILAPLSGAEYRLGREARDEFGEDIEPDQADAQTMGMSCLIQPREYDHPQPFIAPDWADDYPDPDAFPHREHRVGRTNYWWIELGGDGQAIRNTEQIRDALVRAALGVWDHVKHHGEHGAQNWALDWVGLLPGKRESRRYVGDHILTQSDVRSGGHFPDLVAYGGWTMDDHHPSGLRWPGLPTIFHPAPSPFGIPYRCLYSHNIANLFCAGRNISASHAALSATRVMATCATIGQAVGTAAALAIRYNLSPRGVYRERLAELKQTLLEDDCYLPWNPRTVPSLSRQAQLVASIGDPEPLRNGWDRPIGDKDNGWATPAGGWVEYRFANTVRIRHLRIVFDSDLNRPEKPMPAWYPRDMPMVGVPETMTRSFRLEILDSEGRWLPLLHIRDNYLRCRSIQVDMCCQAVRLILEETWGAEQAHLFAWDVGD